MCELDIIFNFHKAYYILDELFMAGELQDTSKREVLAACTHMDDLVEEAELEASNDYAAPPSRSSVGGSRGRTR